VRALILLEDPTLDQYVVRPVVERIFSDLGVTGSVEVLRDPHLAGAKQALDKDIVAAVVADNRMVDLFVLVVDRDCDRQMHANKAAARCAEHPGQARRGPGVARGRGVGARVASRGAAGVVGGGPRGVRPEGGVLLAVRSGEGLDRGARTGS
jgi:hypothetical protein